MPTYEYVCSKCGYRFDKFQSMRAEPLRKCPKCSKAALRRLVGSGAGLIFKGSGFYSTDYRKAGYAKAASTDSKAASADSKAASADSKPAPETKPAGGAKPAGAPAAASPKAAPAAGGASGR